METIELNGITLVLTEATAQALHREIEEEKMAKRRHWLIWHWHARRWAMYGDKDGDGSIFSDLYKEENDCRPHMTREQVFWILYGRECWIEHGPHCKEYRWMSKHGWGLF